MNVSLGIRPPDDVLAAAVAVRDGVPRGADELAATPVDELVMPMVRLGNLTTPSANGLCEYLRERLVGTGTPEVRLAGAWALENDDPTVGLRLDGDVDGTFAVSRALPPVVAELGFFVDRRSFRPVLPLGLVTDRTGLPYLERLVAALDAHEGRPWVLDAVDVLVRTWRDDGSGGYEVLDSVPTA
ncbi:hypothetical protein KC207_04870 [Phycicoccus sp. BSK3Z-2]|uniref:Uncharacterized protein n=1 Tax=Phycicoccus avicenniae TaxID=2828860 RepID=A0A941D6K1_9MICO|nr:hypothetical protein [Phycicoccus avicenniae]MBR7742618.1 hypothetical protein [Phycicoccus avicenniae]